MAKNINDNRIIVLTLETPRINVIFDAFCIYTYRCDDTRGCVMQF